MSIGAQYARVCFCVREESTVIQPSAADERCGNALPLSERASARRAVSGRVRGDVERESSGEVLTLKLKLPPPRAGVRGFIHTGCCVNWGEWGFLHTGFVVHWGG